MFNSTLIVIEAFIRELRTMYERTSGVLEPSYPGILSFVAQLALENIATSDAAYHDVNHTIMVTLVGQEILRGRHISVGGVTPRDWLHFIVSLLGHDIGYVRQDQSRRQGWFLRHRHRPVIRRPCWREPPMRRWRRITLLRSKLFVRERAAKATLVHLDIAQIEANIEHTHFPVPED